MNSLPQKAKNALKDPKRALRIFHFWLYKKTRPIENVFQKKREWKQNDSGLLRKQYTSYAEYLKHQKSKLSKIEHYLHSKYDTKYHDALRKRLQEQGTVQPGMNVLCLAARIGTEVKPFLDLGCFAVGLDLNPGKENKYVVYGDFHDIQFADHSVDVIFSNSLDHALDFDKLITEMQRVLKPNGFLILEIMKGEEEGVKPGYYETSVWKTLDDVLAIFTRRGFSVVSAKDFEYPWLGQHITFTQKATR